MIHLVRSVPRSHSGAPSSKTLSVVSPIADPIEDPIEALIVKTDGAISTIAPEDEPMASRALVVLEHLGAMYPVEMSQAIAPITMSPTMKDLYQNLTVHQVSFNIPSTSVHPNPPKLPANTQFVQDYPSQQLQAPLIPIRARRTLPPLPFLEVGSGLLAFTIVSGVVVVDGLKQAQNGPGPEKRTSPISSNVTDRTTRLAQANTGMSEMEVLKSGRTLPAHNLAMSAPTGPSMAGMNLTPAQMSQLAMQQAIAASKSSKVGTAIAPPTNIIPSLNTFALPQTGEALPAVPAASSIPAASSVPFVPTVPQASAPQPISLSPPVRSPIARPPERPTRQRPTTRQPERPATRPNVVTQPIVLPVPELPINATTEIPIAPPAPPVEPSPSPSPAMPIVRQSMTPEPAMNMAPIEELPRQAVPARSSATQAAIQDDATVTLTPRVLTSMRPETSDAIAPAVLKPAASQDFVPKDLVFKQEIN